MAAAAEAAELLVDSELVRVWWGRHGYGTFMSCGKGREKHC
jgi:hypothetical protein